VRLGWLQHRTRKGEARRGFCERARAQRPRAKGRAPCAAVPGGFGFDWAGRETWRCAVGGSHWPLGGVFQGCCTLCSRTRDGDGGGGHRRASEEPRRSSCRAPACFAWGFGDRAAFTFRSSSLENGDPRGQVHSSTSTTVSIDPSLCACYSFGRLGTKTDGYQSYYICFYISVRIRIRIQIVSTMPDMTQLDIDTINIRFEYLNTDTVSDVEYPDSDTI
jgi:hypothetical protein